MSKMNAENTLDDKYPTISWWFNSDGLVELGRYTDEGIFSMIRVLDMGGMLWEGKDEYESIEEAMNDAEEFLANWKREQFPDRE